MGAPRTPAQIRAVNERYHDAAADEYDAKWGIDFGAKGRRQVLGKLDKALGRGPHGPFHSALEVGAGTGYFSLNLLRAGIVERATCVDISPGMLRALRANAEELGLDVRTEACGAEALPFEDRAFDLVFGHAVLHHLPDLHRAFSEFHRVLVPGGTLAFAGEPSRYGDRLAAVPKRAALALAPVWRTPTTATTPSNATSTSMPLPPASCEAWPATPAFTTSACAARSCSRAGSAGPTGRSRPPPSRTRCRGSGASTPTVATSSSSRSTGSCSSRACRPGCSTTSC
jgi:protein-L-isoaspartate O-methyltransferase